MQGIWGSYYSYLEKDFHRKENNYGISTALCDLLKTFNTIDG
jgi:hypothetical protein